MDLVNYVNKKRKQVQKQPGLFIKEPRDERISMRVTKSEKALISKVASKEGLTITELVLKLINEHNKS